jgi:hypothetical protein
MGILMALFRPHLLVLDSATLGNVSRDYWNTSEVLRNKARTFVGRLRDRGVYVTFTFTHVLELLRHQNESVVHDRLSFLRALPFIAWLRPYGRDWFPGSAADLFARELHAFVHVAKRDWRSIVDNVRMDLWETGVGSEMFVDDDDLWSAFRKKAQHQQRHERYIASVARTDPGNVSHLTVAQVKQLPARPKLERASYARRFVATMKAQLEQHGDRRLEDPQEAAATFANDTFDRIELFEAAGGDPIQRLLESRGVPTGLVTDTMTVADIGQLAVYIKQLAILSKVLQPRVTVTIHDVPPETLPSYVIERRLAAAQLNAARVSGSDLGDGQIAPLVLYADGVEVDKRTCEYLTQVKRNCPAVAGLMGHFFRSGDYSEIPERCGSAT